MNCIEKEEDATLQKDHYHNKMLKARCQNEIDKCEYQKAREPYLDQPFHCQKCTGYKTINFC